MMDGMPEVDLERRARPAKNLTRLPGVVSLPDVGR